MKAFKPDGSRWFAPTASELMDRWLEEPELLDWFSRTVEFRAATPEELRALGFELSTEERYIRELALALGHQIYLWSLQGKLH